MGGLRTCARCKQTLPLNAFNFRDRSRKLRQSYCRDCSNANWRDWYSVPKNKEHHREVLRDRRRRRIERNRKLVRGLKTAACADCGGRFPPEAMDFDHLEDKDELISKLVYTAGYERLRREIEKCEIVCSNCHRIRTAARLGSTVDPETGNGNL